MFIGEKNWIFILFSKKFDWKNIGTREIKIYPQGEDILKICPEGEDIFNFGVKIYAHGGRYITIYI